MSKNYYEKVDRSSSSIDVRWIGERTNERWIIREHRERAGRFWGAVRGLVGIEVGVVSGVFNLESPGVRALGWRLRHEEAYHAS